MTFSHSQRQDVLLHFLVSLSKAEPCALLFGRVHRDPKPYRSDLSFNLRLSRWDRQGLHCMVPQTMAADLQAGDSVMALALMKAREWRPDRRPHLLFSIVYLAVSD